MKTSKYVGWMMGLVLVGALAGCDNEPAKGAAKAVTSAVQPVKEEPAKEATTSTVKYKFDQAESKVQWVGAKITGKHDGGFGTFEGTIDLVDADPTKSRVSVEITMDSLTADAEQLVGHLKSKDFFEVETYPKSRFTSTAVVAGGDGGASHTVTGNLELHDVTKSITFPATITVQGDTVAVKAEFAINRKDFGIVYPGKPDDLIKDDVLLRLNISAKKSQ
ncbi:MAG TPA: YceI family protein [Polyangiaceae bacterium]|nr:YceI family protein [Polyangiaceae bacterium]